MRSLTARSRSFFAMIVCVTACAAIVVSSGCGGTRPRTPAAVVGDSEGGAAAAAELGPSSVAAAARVADSLLLCISSDADGIEVLGWLQNNGLLEGEPFAKMFHEPPITGPRPGVDTTLYVEHWRSICADSSNRVIDIPESVAVLFPPFNSWPDSAQDAFVMRTWRGAIFGTGTTTPPDTTTAPRLGLMAQTLAVTHPATTAAFVIVNEGGGILTWAATDGCPWLTENPSSGTVAHSEGDTVTLTVSWTTFAAGETKTCTVSVGTNGGAATIVLSATKPGSPPPPTGLVDEVDLHFAGAFRGPRGTSCPECLAWGGGAALGFRPAGDAWRGSLWSNGHAYEGRAVEFSIPNPVMPTGDLRDLPIATALKPWGDMTGGRYQTFTDGELKRYGDMLPLPDGRILHVLFDSYGADGRDLFSVIISSSQVTAPQSVGMWHFGPRPTGGDPALNPFHYSRSTGGLDLLPTDWAAALGGYEILASGGWRRGGGTCGSPQGPSLVAVKLGALGAPGTTIPALKLADWPKGGPPVEGNSTCRAPAGDLCSSTTFEDVAVIETSDGRRAVAVLGNICPTTSHYYDPAGVSGPNDPGACGESKGQVCDAPYRGELWLFDFADLLEVVHGQRAENSIAPYRRIDLSRFLAVETCTAGMGGLAFDKARRRLYFSQRGVDGTWSQYDKLALFYRIDVQ